MFFCLSSIVVSCKSNDTQFNPELRDILNQIAAKEFMLFENYSDKQYEFCVNKSLDSTVQSGGLLTLFHKNLIVNTDDGESFFSISQEKDIDSFYYGYVEFLDVMGEIDLKKLISNQSDTIYNKRYEWNDNLSDQVIEYVVIKGSRGLIAFEHSKYGTFKVVR